MSVPPRITQVQFVGGPFDGHVQPFGDSGLIRQLSLPVCGNMLRLLKGEELGPISPVNSLARYALRTVGDDWQYQFVDILSVEGIDFATLLDAGPDATHDDRKTTSRDQKSADNRRAARINDETTDRFEHS